MLEFEGDGPTVVTLEDVINKTSWDSADVEFLIAHMDELPHDVLVKIGIEGKTEPTEEEVQKQIDAITKKKK